MSRMSQRHYEVRTMLAMAVYIAVLLWLWPMARTTGSLPLKWLLALLPVLPMLYVMALMARRVRDSDELEQRMHLLALGFSTIVVGSLSLIGGFLAATKAVTLDGSVLIWVFPVSLLSYHGALGMVARRYEHDMFCREGGFPLLWWGLAVAALMVAVGVYAYLYRDATAAGLLVGIVVGVGLVALVSWLVRARQAPKPSVEETKSGDAS